MLEATGYRYAVHATFKLNGEDVQNLMDLSAMHYDAVCRRAGAHGGFIYGWNNGILSLTDPRFTDKPVSLKDAVYGVTISEYDLQTVCKICEQSATPPAMREFFRDMLKRVHEEFRRLNPPQPTFEENA